MNADQSAIVLPFKVKAEPAPSPERAEIIKFLEEELAAIKAGADVEALIYVAIASEDVPSVSSLNLSTIEVIGYLHALATQAAVQS